MPSPTRCCSARCCLLLDLCRGGPRHPRPRILGQSYQAWIDTYAGEAFHLAVAAVIGAADAAAEGASDAIRMRMHAAFRRATQLEWMFWDSAYRLEAWPV